MYYCVIFRSLGLLAIVGSIYKYIFTDGVERRRRPVGVVCRPISFVDTCSSRSGGGGRG